MDSESFKLHKHRSTFDGSYDDLSSTHQNMLKKAMANIQVTKKFDSSFFGKDGSSEFTWNFNDSEITLDVAPDGSIKVTIWPPEDMMDDIEALELTFTK